MRATQSSVSHGFSGGWVNPMDDEEFTLHEIEQSDPNLYREAALRFMSLLHYVINRMPDSVEKWGIAFATASPICNGLSMTVIAKRLGVSRAAISHEARKCCSSCGLPASSYMKSDKASVAARKARRKAVIEIHNKNQKRNEQ